MAAGIVTSCGKKSEDNENKDSVRVEQVKVTTLKTQEINRIVDISTTLDGWETVNIAPTIQGHIEKLYVDVDSKVGAGQMLVKMDETQYNNIKLAFANLKVEFARMEALKKTGSVSQQAYDQGCFQHARLPSDGHSAYSPMRQRTLTHPVCFTPSSRSISAATEA